MEGSRPNLYIKVNSSKCILKSELLSLLKTYNCYHEGKSFQLRHREEEGELIIEGLLNISWGLRRPIRLQMQDDNERVCLPSSEQWKTEQSGLNRCESKDRVKEPNNNAVITAISLKPDISATDQSIVRKSSKQQPPGNTNPLIYSFERLVLKDTETLEQKKSDSCEEEVPQLMRTKSDASFMVQRRNHSHSPSEVRKIKRHRFSINGHFYNHKTSVFTPAYGSMTNVRVKSTMTTPQVLSLLLNKFRVENSTNEFALYLVHESGERSKLKDTEYPLISRILHGPCEKIAKIFLMETDLGEEVPHDVAQYIKFEMPVLDSFVEKLKEEEEREINKLTLRFSVLRLMIQQHLKKLVDTEDHV